MKQKNALFALFIMFSCTSLDLTAEDVFRSNYGEYYYLESGLVISQHVIEPTFSSFSDWHGVADLNKRNSYRLREKQTRYLDVQFLSCGIDPFSPRPSIDHARNMVRDCLRAHVWENDDIPDWAKYVGTALALGAASESGALDNEISVNIDLTTLNQLFNTQNQ
jgi:hypothetical protein